MEAQRSQSVGTTAVCVVVLGFLAARLLAAAYTNLVPDEAYYWLWSRHPSAGYYDHPPMAAWWIWLSTRIFGDSVLGVRALSILSIVPISAAVYLTAGILFDRLTAGRAVIWLNATLLMGVGGLIATPDAPSVLFWSLATLAFALVVHTQRPIWWLAVGLGAGLGALSKLTNLFLGLGLLLALLYDRDMRRWLVTPWPWLGAGVAAATVVPMILWNAGHGWVTFTVRLRDISGGPLSPYYLGEVIIVQALLFNPFLSVFVGLAAVSWFRGKLAAGTRATGLLFATTLPLIAYMSAHALQARVEGNWLAPVYPTLAVAAAAATSVITSQRWAATLPRLRATILPFGAVVSVIGLFLFAVPDGTVPLKLDFAKIVRQWPGLAADVDRISQETGATWIATTNYAVNAELAYYLRDRDVPVAQITDRILYAFEPPPDRARLRGPALVVASGTALPGNVATCFANIVPVGQVARQGIEVFSLYLAEGPATGLLAGEC